MRINFGTQQKASPTLGHSTVHNNEKIAQECYKMNIRDLKPEDLIN